MKNVRFVGLPKGLLIISLILGTIVYLVKEHPIAFWCLYVPLILIMVTSFIRLLTGGRGQVGNIVTILFVFIVMIGALPFFTIPESAKCEHEEMGNTFHFQFENSTAASYMRPFCKNCDEVFGHKNFRGTPIDLSFLEAIVENSDGTEIVGGEYYTMKVIMMSGCSDFDRLRIGCKVQNEDAIVYFSAEFQEEFRDAVKEVHMGDEITFRGRFYDNGCGFTDCELIIE